VLDEHGFGHHRAGTAGTSESGNGRQQMQKQDGQIAHRRILQRSRQGQRKCSRILEFAMHTLIRVATKGVRYTLSSLSRLSKMLSKSPSA
jgi:hypothetical protein